MQDITMISLAQAAELVRTGKVSPVELVEACLKRTENLQGELNAYITLLADEARAAAKKAEKEVKTGYKGPLHGIPVALKDLFNLKGVRVTAGSELMLGNIPDWDSTVVARLKAAGAIIMGTLNTHEWALGPTNEESYFGPSRNPWDAKKIPGGSSGGSAVAVATGMVYMAMGTDAGGSISIPSAMCGSVGLKPNNGRVSLYGMVPISFNLDHPGPMTRSVLDAAITMDALTGPDPLDPCPGRLDDATTNYATALAGVKDLRGRIIGLPTNFFFDKTNDEIEKLLRAAVEVLKELGATIKEIHVPDLETVPATTATIMFCEAAYAHQQRFAAHSDKYTPGVRQRIEKGLKITALDYINALKERERVKASWAETTEGLDAVVVPTTPITAYDIGTWELEIKGKMEDARTMCGYHTRLANLTGAPALSVPCGFSGGLPVGMMLLGRYKGEGELLAVAHAYEQARPFKYKEYK